MCELDTSSTKAFLDPPNEVKHLLKIGLGMEFGIAPIPTFLETMDDPDNHDSCGELATIMNSNKNFAVVSVSNPIDAAAKVVFDDAAADTSCASEKEKRTRKRKYKSCPGTESALAEEGIENPVSLVLDMVLPLCMG